MKHLAGIPAIAIAAAAAAPASAASGPFISLGNTDFIVLISFIIFIGALAYFKAPQFAGKLIDGRIDIIRKRIEEAKSLRNDAQENLERLKRERAEAEEQAKRIVEGARKDAEAQTEMAGKEIERAVNRRLRAADEQMEAAEAEIVASIRNQAVDIAVAVAGEVIAAKMDADDRKRMIDRSLRDIEKNLN